MHQSAAFYFFQLAAAHVRGGVVDDAGEGFALVVRAVAVAHELHDHQSLSQDDLLTAEALADAAQHHHLHELFALVGHGAEAVLQPLAVGLQRAVVFDGVELAVEQHALRRARHIRIGEVHRQVALHRAVGDE